MFSVREPDFNHVVPNVKVCAPCLLTATLATPESWDTDILDRLDGVNNVQVQTASR